MTRTRNTRLSFFLFSGVALWLLTVVSASRSGWLGALSPLAPPPIAALTILIPSLIVLLRANLRAYFAEVGLRRLTSIHILRIAAVPLFFWYGSRGLLPQPFVQAAAWGDLAAGVLALAVVLWWARPAGYWTMHIFGMIDFVTAFGTAMALTRANPGAMHAVTGLPIALIPFFGVGILATIHVIAFRLLWQSGTRRSNISLRAAGAR